MLDLVLLTTILRRLSLPFERWPAFVLGVIDKDGQILIPRKDLSLRQKDSFTPLHNFIRNMKLMIYNLPGGKAKIANLASILFLLKESTIEQDVRSILEGLEQDIIDQIMAIISGEMDELLDEDMPAPTNTTSSSINASSDFVPSKGKGKKSIFTDTLLKESDLYEIMMDILTSPDNNK